MLNIWKILIPSTKKKEQGEGEDKIIEELGNGFINNEPNGPNKHKDLSLDLHLPCNLSCGEAGTDGSLELTSQPEQLGNELQAQ